MKDKQIEEAIIKGIESKGAIDVGNEIANAILSENSQNNEFIEAKTAGETPICETQTIINDVPTSNENGTNKQDNKQTFGKFKNPEELLKAYLELEKEFTKNRKSSKRWKRTMTSKILTRSLSRLRRTSFFAKPRPQNRLRKTSQSKSWNSPISNGIKTV